MKEPRAFRCKYHELSVSLKASPIKATHYYKLIGVIALPYQISSLWKAQGYACPNDLAKGGRRKRKLDNHSSKVCNKEELGFIQNSHTLYLLLSNLLVEPKVFLMHPILPHQRWHFLRVDKIKRTVWFSFVLLSYFKEGYIL